MTSTPALDNQNAYQRNSMIVLGYVAVVLLFLEYFGSQVHFNRLFPEYSRLNGGLFGQLWWAGWSIFLYLIVPIGIVKLVFKQRLADFGWQWQIKRQYLYIYLGMIVFMLPLVWYASTLPGFIKTYPFYRGAFQAPIGDVLLWESAYLFQFLALEFFFRGFIIFTLEKRVGTLSVWMAMVPYVMIHFHKPALEAMGAIIAGLVLGELARRSHSIFGGVLVHVSVAATMDILALTAAH